MIVAVLEKGPVLASLRSPIALLLTRLSLAVLPVSPLPGLVDFNHTDRNPLACLHTVVIHPVT